VSALPEDAQAELSSLLPLLGARGSLAPGRPRAPTPAAIAEQVVSGSGDQALVRAFTRGLSAVIRAIADDFPDNIFWDLDYLASCLWRAGAAPAISGFAQRVVALSRGFGKKSALRFRYAHDLFYGYDWARWVTRKPEERAHIGPFDLAFFDYLDGRQKTLLELVESNDVKYGQLKGKEFRNAFTFSREPREEAWLHRTLAEENLIPVKAWHLDGPRSWELPYADLRAEAARRLGLSRSATS
jgi:hypothetical protein